MMKPVLGKTVFINACLSIETNRDKALRGVCKR
jgi:hypothetical protein